MERWLSSRLQSPPQWSFSVPLQLARYNYDREGPRVTPCSLVGVNPVYHPRIFGDPAFAKAYYGFVQGRDRTWHVMPNCRKPAFIGPGAE